MQQQEQQPHHLLLFVRQPRFLIVYAAAFEQHIQETEVPAVLDFSAALAIGSCSSTICSQTCQLKLAKQRVEPC